ncbi:MAG: hypothetical protein CVU19_04250 [Betaproteobacteria bacterium HGW-Betaproteobacteria-13]|jgi:hypothetical protein|uniref:Uncharacterized protein n=1 Tax=Parazoarcus communis TaxID=41977 RepID=A0A2U8GZY1_9RHOO|nr:hypothetical protein [Parazoarcus communis]AWI79277.1 hypothetical protein CEW87_07810 [Parazoarcus communis]PKO81939.1 MAG: hypothetical protein CVU19_04250 [Betaproteobacteria bacterium HGW-Betaproteobacteria-13]
MLYWRSAALINSGYRNVYPGAASVYRRRRCGAADGTTEFQDQKGQQDQRGQSRLIDALAAVHLIAPASGAAENSFDYMDLTNTELVLMGFYIV